MIERIMVALLLAPIVLWVCYLPDERPLFALLLLASATGLNEFFQVMAARIPMPKRLCIGTGLACYLAGFVWGVPGLFCALLLTTLVIILREIRLGEVEGATHRVTLAFFANLYIPGLLCFAFFLRREFSPGYLLSVILLTWATDSFAYFFGTAFGRWRMLPKISPKKTFEGLVAGTLFGILFFLVFFSTLVRPEPLLKMALPALFLSLIAGAGDLFASLCKRDMGVKDFSAAIPGHGGLMDRLNSLLFAFPAAFYLGKIFGL